jgi:putative FmdB family regulatory protein
MPTYVYACEDCENTFEITASIKEKEEGLQPKCPQCFSDNSRQLITASFTIRGGGNGNVPLGGCNPGGGCCG